MRTDTPLDFDDTRPARPLVKCPRPRCHNAAGIVSGLCANHAQLERDRKARTHASALRLVVGAAAKPGALQRDIDRSVMRLAIEAGTAHEALTTRGLLAETIAQLHAAIARGNAFARVGLAECDRLRRENRDLRNLLTRTTGRLARVRGALVKQR